MTAVLPPVMVVDDDPSIALLIGHQLAAIKLANPVRWIDNGDLAVAGLHECAVGDRLPALVLLDQEMPGRSGLEVLAWMATHPKLQMVPVVVLSGHSQQAEIAAAHRMGARSYLVKPVGLDILGNVLRRLDADWAFAGDT